MENEPEIDEAASEPEKASDSQAKGSGTSVPSSPHSPTSHSVSEPFWNSKGFVAFLALLGASIAPVMSWIAKDSELRLAEADHTHTQALAAQEQRHKIRMDYFSRAIDPANDAEYRERVLRFLRRSEDDEPLQAWALEELEIIAPEARERREAEGESRARIQQLTREVRESSARAEAETTEERAQRQRAESELAAARAELDRIAQQRSCQSRRAECERACRVDEAQRSQAIASAAQIEDDVLRQVAMARASLPQTGSARCLMDCALVECGN